MRAKTHNLILQIIVLVALAVLAAAFLPDWWNG
jgi:hypothetical protein